VSAVEAVLRAALGPPPARPLRPVLLSIGLNFAGLAAFSVYFGPWLVGVLHASAYRASAAYVAAGAGGVLGAVLGGWLSDRHGRRPVLLAAGAGQVAVAGCLLLPGVTATPAAILLVAMTFLQPVRGVAQRAALADLAPAAEEEVAFAGYRLAINAGSFAGPLAGAALVARSWWVLHAGVAALYLASLVAGSRLSATRPALTGPPDRAEAVAGGRGAAVRRWWERVRFRDSRLAWLLLGTAAAWTVVYAYETVLPIVLTQSYGVAPATWGAIYSAGPVLVVLFQLRLTGWLRPLPVLARLVGGTALMGAAFLVLLVDVSVGAAAAVLVVFLAGDLVWGPASEAAPVRIAPAHRRGAYLGVLTAAIWVGSALAPGLGLPLRAWHGDGPLWLAVFGVALLAVGCYCRADSLGRRARAEIRR
jgi:MFS family permease